MYAFVIRNNNSYVASVAFVTTHGLFYIICMCVSFVIHTVTFSNFTLCVLLLLLVNVSLPWKFRNPFYSILYTRVAFLHVLVNSRWFSRFLSIKFFILFDLRYILQEATNSTELTILFSLLIECEFLFPDIGLHRANWPIALIEKQTKVTLL